MDGRMNNIINLGKEMPELRVQELKRALEPLNQLSPNKDATLYDYETDTFYRSDGSSYKLINE